MGKSSYFVKQRSRRMLYRWGGIAALLAALVFRRNLGAEISLIHPIQPPQLAADWLHLLNTRPILGLAYLDALDPLEYLLVFVMFLALASALRKNHRAMLNLFWSAALLAAALNLAANPAFALLHLSRQYLPMSSEGGRLLLLASADALLAARHGTAAYASLLLISLAGLGISIVMLRSRVFSRVSAILGITANAIMLSYFLLALLLPGWTLLAYVLSAPLRVAWYLLAGLRLLKLSRG